MPIHRSLSDVPGPSGLSFPLLRKYFAPHLYFLECAVKYGGLCRLPFGAFGKTLLVTDRDIAKTVLGNRTGTFDRGDRIIALRPFTNDSTLAAPHPETQKSRESMITILANLEPELIRRSCEIEAGRVFGHIDQTQTAKADTDMALFMLGVMGRLLFGVPITGDEALLLHHAFDAIEHRSHVSWVLRFPHRVPRYFPTFSKSSRHFACVRDILRKYVDRTESRTPSVCRAFRSHVDENRLFDEMLGLLLAGYRTPATSLSWILYHHAEEKLRSGANDNPVSFLIRRGLFNSPSSWCLSRTVASSTSVADVSLQSGTRILISQYVINKLSPGALNEIDRVPQLSFGHGPRSCLGQHLSLAIMQHLLEWLLKRFEISRDPASERIAERALITLRPRTPIELKFKPLSKEPW